MISIDLSGTVVAVTGSSGGVGSGIARRFADAGAAVVLQHHRSDAPSLEAPGGTCTVETDLTHADGPSRVVAAAVESFGKLDAIVNNAGIQPVAPFMEIDDNEWNAMLDTNVTACHRLTKAFAEHVFDRQAAGSVVHIASIEGTHPAIGHSHYCTSKAALIMHARAAAVELGPKRVRVNSVSPGLIHRPGIEEAWPDGVERWATTAPLQRMGQPDDIGDACVFLCSPLADWITGVDLVVDGGVSACNTW